MSIIMIVGGILGAIGSFFIALFAALGSAVLSSSEGQQELQNQLSSSEMQTVNVIMPLLWIGAIILIAGAVVEIIAGVKGKKNWNNPDQAQSLMILGIVVAVLSLVGNILFATGGTGPQIVTILSGLVVPVLYIVGTIQLKKQA